MNKKLLSVFFLLVNISGVVAQNNNQTLDKSLQNIYSKSNFPGFAIAIIKPDTVLFSKGYGFANRVTKTSYTDESH
jgi:hypothetical protein